jgi:kynurenine formamidase
LALSRHRPGVVEPSEGAVPVIGQFVIAGQTVRTDFSRGVCLAIPLEFDGAQPSHFGAPPATARPMEAGGFVGDTRRGGSCNVPIITINPHCNGTHSESISHIVNESVSVSSAMGGQLVPASVISVMPVAATASPETYRPALEARDRVITATALTAALRDIAGPWVEAVVIRTLPNDETKRVRRYGEQETPPFFTIEAIDYLSGRGVRHLLVDVSSVDRMHDEGLLTVHHRFWQVPEGRHSLSLDSRLERTITEMIFVPDEVADGPYLLSLQVPAFGCDAAPSRPWLYPVEFT